MPSKRQTLEKSTDYKVVVFGDAGVGKTSLLMQIMQGTFKDHYVPTVEDSYSKMVTCDGTVFTLQIIDTGGSHSFPAMVRLAIQRSQAFILVYSVCDRKSFDDIKRYYDTIISTKTGMCNNFDISQYPIIVVGNKCDIPERAVSETEGVKIAKTWQCGYIETSAKRGIRTTEVLEELLIKGKYQKLSIIDNESSKTEKPKSTDRVKKKCMIM